MGSFAGVGKVGKIFGRSFALVSHLPSFPLTLPVFFFSFASMCSSSNPIVSTPPSSSLPLSSCVDILGRSSRRLLRDVACMEGVPFKEIVNFRLGRVSSGSLYSNSPFIGEHSSSSSIGSCFISLIKGAVNCAVLHEGAWAGSSFKTALAFTAAARLLALIWVSFVKSIVLLEVLINASVFFGSSVVLDGVFTSEAVSYKCIF